MERRRSDQPHKSEAEILRDMVAELENMEFHHSPLGSKERDHYDRVVALEEKVSAQAKKSGYRVYTEEEHTKASREVDHRHD